MAAQDPLSVTPGNSDVPRRDWAPTRSDPPIGATMEPRDSNSSKQPPKLSPEQLDARALARSRRSALRRRVHRIRRGVAGLAAALFAAAFLAVYVQLASGHDPALSTKTRTTAASTSTGSSSAKSSLSGSSATSRGTESSTTPPTPASSSETSASSSSHRQESTSESSSSKESSHAT